MSSSVEDLLEESDQSLVEKAPVTFKSEIGGLFFVFRQKVWGVANSRNELCVV